MNNLPLELDNGGNSSRDFIYVKDIVLGLIACAIKGEAGEAYNLASGVETKILALSKIIKEITNSDSEIVLKPKREWDNSGKRFGSTDKSSKFLSFQAKTEIKDGILKTVKWTQKNKNQILKNINKHSKYVKD